MIPTGLVLLKKLVEVVIRERLSNKKKSCIPMNTRYKDNTFLQQKQFYKQKSTATAPKS